MKKCYFTVITVLLFGVCAAQPVSKWKITDLEQFILQSNKSLVVNFWATWCEPCVKELPWFIEASEKSNAKFSLVLVSMDMKKDYPEKVARFIKEKNIRSKVVWLDETNADYFCPRVDSSWSGSLPATVIIDKKTGKRSFYEKAFNKEELEKLLGQLN